MERAWGPFRNARVPFDVLFPGSAFTVSISQMQKSLEWDEELKSEDLTINKTVFDLKTHYRTWNLSEADWNERRLRASFGKLFQWQWLCRGSLPQVPIRKLYK